MKHSAPNRSQKQRVAAARRQRLAASTPEAPHTAATAAAPAPLTLARQESDLTAEGSPPPGKVGQQVPATLPPRAAKA
jgi:hypothetical protein